MKHVIILAPSANFLIYAWAWAMAVQHRLENTVSSLVFLFFALQQQLQLFKSYTNSGRLLLHHRNGVGKDLKSHLSSRDVGCTVLQLAQPGGYLSAHQTLIPVRRI